MHASHFFLVPEGTDQLRCTCMRLLDCWEKMCISSWELGWPPRKFAQFLGRVADCYPDLHKFCVEQPYWGKLHNFDLSVDF